MEPSNSSKHQPHQNLLRAFTTLRDHCSAFLQNLSQNPLLQNLSQNPRLKNIQTHSLPPPLHARLCPAAASPRTPPFARIPQQYPTTTQVQPLSTEALEERLAGVPVYALCNSDEDFVLVSAASTGKSLGLFCFKKEDAEALLRQMNSVYPDAGDPGSKVVAVALNKVFQLKLNGVAFRLIPESSQVKNALMEREMAGFSDDSFPGVPVFQSKSLFLKSQNKTYRPLFFRKEDLVKSLLRASHQQNKLNPSFRQGDIQVAVFEDVLKNMKDSSSSAWDDVVFIPPGFDVSTAPSQPQAAVDDD